MKSQLFIPKKCKVGFNLRQDTYTGKLGYIIMHDGKTWRKENSWESWREKEATEELKQECLDTYKERSLRYPVQYPPVSSFEELPSWSKRGIAEGVAPVEFDNVPTEGFVLNKKAGGQSWGWNPRQTYCRVYDPRGFEFEITIQNLLFILQETTSAKGKGLEGEFVYSWDGKDLVLLPVGCEEYKKSSGFTSLQDKKIELKTLVEGGSYKTKKEEVLIYLGKFDWWDWKTKYTQTENKSLFSRSYRTSRFDVREKKKKLVFFNQKVNNFVSYDKVDKLAECISDTPVSNYAELVDNYFKSEHGFIVSELIAKPMTEPVQHNFYHKVNLEKEGNLYLGHLHTYSNMCHSCYEAAFNVKVILKDNKITMENNHSIIVKIPKDDLSSVATKLHLIYAVNSQGQEILLNSLK